MAHTSESLTFHPRCGKNVKITEGGLKLAKANYEDHHCSALTSRPLRTSELFKIELTGQPKCTTLGITTHSPEELVEFPHFMHQEKGVWALVCIDDGRIYIDGEVVNYNFCSEGKLYALRKGDTIALMVTEKRELHYYVNGEHVGVAADKIPDTVYGFVDLYRYHCTPVKLVPVAEEEA